jgi:hypothetical protein
MSNNLALVRSSNDFRQFIEHMLVVGLAPDILEEGRFDPPLDAFEAHEDNSLK